MASRDSAKADGFENIKFGASFEQVTTIVGLDKFSSASVKDCALNLAVRGCNLALKDALTPFKTISGIAYGLVLRFNRSNKLTDIGILFSRSAREDADERMSEAECASILERTVDWVSRDYGAVFDPASKDREGAPLLKSKAGNAYWLNPWPAMKGFTVQADKVLVQGRKVSIRAVYHSPGPEAYCMVEVFLSDAPGIPRPAPSPKEIEQDAEAARLTATPKRAPRAAQRLNYADPAATPVPPDEMDY